MSSNPQFLADLITFTEEILNGKLYFCAVKLSASFEYLDTKHADPMTHIFITLLPYFMTIKVSLHTKLLAHVQLNPSCIFLLFTRWVTPAVLLSFPIPRVNRVRNFFRYTNHNSFVRGKVLLQDMDDRKIYSMKSTDKVLNFCNHENQNFYIHVT